MAILFLHIGWAREYRGAADDPVQGAFGYIADGNCDMGDAWNFAEIDGWCFGYAPVPHGINIQNLGGGGADEVVGVLVIWTATNPDGSGRYIVGWYNNAHVFHNLQPHPDTGRYFFAKATVANCRLLPVDDRTFFIPNMLPGWPGVASVFYADNHLDNVRAQILSQYVTGHLPNSPGFADLAPAPPPVDGANAVHNPDPEQRARIEAAAVQVVRSYYQNRGWRVDSVENDNLGWDLTVSLGNRQLFVEVKGRQGNGAVQLTPNEYGAMNEYATFMRYRLAIVFHALEVESHLRIFSYVPGRDEWVCGDHTLRIEERIGALVNVV